MQLAECADSARLDRAAEVLEADSEAANAGERPGQQPGDRFVFLGLGAVGGDFAFEQDIAGDQQPIAVGRDRARDGQGGKMTGRSSSLGDDAFSVIVSVALEATVKSGLDGVSA